MDIGALKEKITVQVAEVAADEIGNRENTWTDAFSCWATVSDNGGSETETAGQTIDTAKASFTIRYCNAVEAVGKKSHRIIHRGKVYNIEVIDNLSYKKNAVKIIGSLESGEVAENENG